MKISGHIIDIKHRTTYNGELEIEEGRIVDIKPVKEVTEQYILPGFIDSHIHIESSLATPQRFAEKAIEHGTLGAVCDPHEIANICDVEGVMWMLENAKDVPFYFWFGAPNCVPATPFEDAGGDLDSEKIASLLNREDIHFLSEMMNFPGVINEDAEVLRKITYAKRLNKPIDGHAPGLRGHDLKKYIAAGITTDHESISLWGAIEKIKQGMKIQIREGSAASSLEFLHPLIKSDPEMLMFCSDDIHPDSLLKGHINLIVKKALKLGYDLFDILRIASLHPVEHYKIPMGLLQKNDFADFIIIDSIENFNILSTYYKGEKIYSNERNTIKLQHKKQLPINNFNVTPITKEDLQIIAKKDKNIRVIKCSDKCLVTEELIIKPTVKGQYLESDTEKDILKLVVVNRYKKEKPTIGFINGFGLKQGSIATSISHDSHNIIAVGCCDEEICEAINLLIKNKGGISVVSENKKKILTLEVGGIMTDNSIEDIAKEYAEINEQISNMGSLLTSPQMTLSFMSLLVIPSLKLSNKGLFNGNKFEFCNLQCE